MLYPEVTNQMLVDSLVPVTLLEDFAFHPDVEAGIHKYAKIALAKYMASGKITATELADHFVVMIVTGIEIGKRLKAKK